MTPPPGDSWRPPRGPRAQSQNQKNSEQNQQYQFRGNQNPHNVPGGGQFFFRQPKPAGIANRPLLSRGRAASPDQVFGGGDGTPKFRSTDNITDTETEDMVESDDETDRPVKKPRLASQWSNPDPYTALPPEGSATPGKKFDVVKLIRKARVSGADTKLNDADQQEDFISFGDMPVPVMQSIPTATGQKRKRNDKGGALRASHGNGVVLPNFSARDDTQATPWFRVPSSSLLAGAS